MARNPRQQKQMEKFAKWLNATWLELQRRDNEAGRLARDERAFVQWLGVEYNSYARWRDVQNPVSDINLLLIAANTGDVTPLAIFEKEDILRDRDLVELITRWKSLPVSRREQITELATGEGEAEGSTVPA